MIIVRLEGGLGNSMFQYALGRHLSIRHSTDLRFDVSSYATNPLGNYSFSLEAFSIAIHDNLASPEEIRRFARYMRRPGRHRLLYNFLYADQRKYVLERHYQYDPSVLADTKADAYLHGWWQCERYFTDIRDVLLKDFTVATPLEGKNRNVSERIRGSAAISMHVRRLDYVANPVTRNYHGELPKSYYDEALRRICEHVSNPVLFVFSDDAAWARTHMTFPVETYYVEGNDDAPHEDLRLMSLCKHHIIANSSFSWWGAWLNPSSDKLVVAPYPWLADTSKQNTADVVPVSWIKLDPHYIRS